MAKNKTIKITLKKSLIGRLPKHVATAKGLGLSRINQSVEREDTPCVRGMVSQLSYLLAVEES